MTLAAPFDGFQVRFIPAVRAAKPYVCPECNGEVPASTGHVCAWPDGESDRRRHWHTHCWRLVVRRGRVDGV